MAMQLVLAALLGLSASAGAAKSVARSQGPVQKITDLLKEMNDQLQLDEKSEQKMYDKYACWCKDASGKKAEAIETAQADLRELGQSILTLKGETATLAAEIAKLEADLEENAKLQEEATALRAKRNEAYLAFTAETKQAMVALEKAIYVLIKGATATPGEEAALLQTQGRQVVQHVVESLPSMANLKASQTALLAEFLRGGSKYTPQSMSVQGILKDMYATFATDVEEATKTEADQNREFENLIATLIEQANNWKAEKAAREELKAEKESTLADESQLYDETEAQMEADIAFFDTTAKACEAKHAEWTLRSALRAEEMKGIQEAITLLSTDEARELLASAIKEGKEVNADTSAYDTGADTLGTFAPALVQVGKGDSRSPVLSAYKALKEKATYAKSLRLAALAAQVHEAKAGHFDTVIAAIDKTVQDLKEEEAADIAKRDQCKEEITQSNSTILDLTWKIKCNEAKIDKLQRKIEEKQAMIAESRQVIKETYAYMNETTEIRTQDNADFIQAKKTDQSAIELLVTVRDTLSKYYHQNTTGFGTVQGAVKGAALTQKRDEPEFKVSEFEAPDATFSKSTHRIGEAKGVVSLLTMVIEDLNDEIANDMKSEEAAQLAYEEQMHVARVLIAQNEAKIVFLEGVIAKTEVEKADEIELMNQNSALWTDEKTFLDGILPDCNWVFKAFFERADKRAAEMEGLTAAKEYLVGYNPNADVGAGYIAEQLPQGAALAQLAPPKFDDEALSRLRFGLRR
ncbi:unnamed protein product [Prorocentrum cordatum]|uniref:Cilia- and flagella-associated protein 206 n=2 Tax=Prorocentrum cordatum TaxID=2364126 RepID=A0ABN9WWD7_9DINO|nr:unnamed protein product [Polarella glacialis]